ncbi:MAG TPA: Flp family type IVb pilin [Phycisphaerae bacterium]|nr:Flp family type IVb pilin [Phycisphaerae bacterium]
MPAKALTLLRMCWRRRLSATDAATAAEYAILLALVIIVSIGAIGLIGERFLNLYVLIANAVGDTI